MFLLSSNTIHITEKSLALKSRLNQVRSKLHDARTSVVDLECKLISLIAHPELAKPSTSETKENDSQNKSNNSSLINPDDILSNLSDAWSQKKGLSNAEGFLIGEITEFNKKEKDTQPKLKTSPQA